MARRTRDRLTAPHVLRRLVLAGCAALTLTLAAEVAWLVGLLPVTRNTEATTSPDAQPVTAIDANEALATADYQIIWSVDWRRPLYDPPPPKPKPKKVVKPRPPRVRLLGTVVEPDNSFAWLRDGAGKQQLCRVGDTIDGGYRVESIETGTLVVVGQADHRFTLTVKKDTR